MAPSIFAFIWNRLVLRIRLGHQRSGRRYFMGFDRPDLRECVPEISKLTSRRERRHVVATPQRRQLVAGGKSGE